MAPAGKFTHLPAASVPAGAPSAIGAEGQLEIRPRGARPWILPGSTTKSLPARSVACARLCPRRRPALMPGMSLAHSARADDVKELLAHRQLLVGGARDERARLRGEHGATNEIREDLVRAVTGVTGRDALQLVEPRGGDNSPGLRRGCASASPIDAVSASATTTNLWCSRSRSALWTSTSDTWASSAAETSGIWCLRNVARRWARAKGASASLAEVLPRLSLAALAFTCSRCEPPSASWPRRRTWPDTACCVCLLLPLRPGGDGWSS